MGIGKKFYLAAASLVVAVGAFVAFNATGSQALSSFRNCNDDAIIRCGAITEAELLDKYDQNVGDVQSVYNHYGITRDLLAGKASGVTVAYGTVYQDGRVVVNGKTVATGAFSVSRIRYTSAGMPRNVVINGKTYYEGPSMAIFTGPVDAYVYLKDGAFYKAVLSSCGNPLIATPEKKPVFKCDSLSYNKIDRTRFEFTAAATAKDGAAIAHYVFDFGDGSTKTQNSNVVEHTYANPGTYTVKVKVNISINGERQYVTSKDCEVVIKVEKAPSFACEKLTFKKIDRTRFEFTAAATAKDGAAIAHYVFDFGDGSSKTQNSNVVEHEYAQAGTYTAKVKVNISINGERQYVTSENCEVTIKVEEKPEIPFYTCDSLTETKISRTKFGFATEATAENGAEIVNYTYNFGDGSTVTGGDTVEHTYANAGTYTATVTVNFRVKGEIVSKTGDNCKVTIEIEKEPVYKCDSLEQTKLSRNRFSFATEATAENGAEIVNYTYNFGDGISTTTGSTVSHTYTNPGTYTAIVMVNFRVNGQIVSKGGENCKVTIKVEKEPVYTCDSLTQTKITRTKFRFAAKATAENGAEVVDYNYNFGDSTTLNNAGSTVEHTYATPGTYTATVTVNFRVNGEVVSRTSENCKVTIEVAKEPAYKCDNLELAKISRTRFKFTTSATAENGAEIVNYTYNFGDGTSATNGNSIEHTYANAGTYTATVTVNFRVNGQIVRESSEDCKVEVNVEEAPVYTCDSLNAQKISRTKFGFTTKATAENGAEIVDYSYDFGDGNKAANAGSTVEHTYAAPGTYTATVTVNFNVEGKAESKTGANCKVTVEVEEEKVPVYKCESLTAQKLSRDRYRFTATASATNAQIVGYTFTFGDGSNDVAVADQTVEHTYAAPGTYTAKVTAHFMANNEAKTDTNVNCEVVVTIPAEDVPSIEIVKTVNGKEHVKVGVGVEFTYEITVYNTGNIALKDAVVTDKAPSEVTLLSASEGMIVNNEWTTTIAELKVGESKSFTLKAKYPIYAAGTHKNTVCVDTPTIPEGPDDCDEATTETNEPIKVCDLNDNTVKQIEKSEFDESHMTTDLSKCGEIKVCIIEDKVIKVIAKNEYDESTMTTDFSKCETPVVPPELPKTGLDMFIGGGLGLGSITAAGYYWTASRRNLLSTLLKR